MLFLLTSIAMVSTLVAWAGVRILARRPIRLLLDVPNDRSSHTRPTPRGGGLAIVLVTGVGCSLTWLFAVPESRFLPVYLAAGLTVALVSWLDDLWSLSALPRFGTHLAAALLLIFALPLESSIELPLVARFDAGAWFPVVVLLWVVGLTNLYNFMDGIDGLAAAQAVIAGGAWSLLGAISGEFIIQLTGILLAASSLGFLLHNWAPASIFLGDVGSAFLGFSFACLAVAGNSADPRLGFAGLLAVWPFVADGTFSLVRRLVRKENVFAAHRSHLYQRLVIAGYSHGFVAVAYSGMALVGALIGVLWAQRMSGTGTAVLLLPILFALLWLFVLRAERACGGADRGAPGGA